jgi:recombination protein RecA
MAKKKQSEDKGIDVKHLAEELVDDLNRTYKKEGVFSYTGGDSLLTDVKDYITTGDMVLDLAISNVKNGGWPVGRIVEIFGLPGSGKSMLAAMAVAETQKRGGIGVYFDTEAALYRPFFESLGVDMDTLILPKTSQLEEIYSMVERLVTKVREDGNEKLVTIVIDSMMGAKTKNETEGSYEKEGWNTDKAIINGKAMRKLDHMLSDMNVLLIITNQLRVNLNVTFGDPYKTSGGEAIGFHSSVRVYLKKIGKESDKKSKIGKVKGVHIKAEVTKNRLGPSHRDSEFTILYESGLDKYGSFLDLLNKLEIVHNNSGWNTYEYTDKSTGEVSEIKFRAKDFREVLKVNEGLWEELYNAACDEYIMKYSKPEGDDVLDKLTDKIRNLG